MPYTPNSTLPAPLPIGDALDQSQVLGHLRARLQASQRCFDQIRPVLPAALMTQLRPGPIDEQGWVLLASNAAVAAKLRQWLPRLEAVLREQGWQGSGVKVRVQSS